MGVVGTLTSLMIDRLLPAAPGRAPEVNPFRYTPPALYTPWEGTEVVAAAGGGGVEVSRLGYARGAVWTLWKETKLFRTAVGIGFFWFLASLAQLNADPL